MELDKIAPALVAFQADLTPVSKSATNPFFKSKYAPLPEVMEAIQPLLAKHKLAIIQLVTNIDGVSALNTIVLHESGQKLEAIQPLLLTKQDPQAQGSAITYARRYGVMSALGIVADEDDDGNKAVQAAKQTTVNRPTPEPAPQRPTAPKPVADDKPTKTQLDTIYNLAIEKGMSDEEIRRALAKVTTGKMAEASIKKLMGDE